MAGLLTLPQPGDVVGGKYLLESVVERCELGVVYAARHAQTGRRFALRWLAGSGLNSDVPSDQAGLQLNTQVVGCFQHSLVLSPLDFGRTPSARYLVMEWLEGETLSKRLNRVSKLSLSDAARLLVPCMMGLHAAHLAQVVHGELHPGNIFVCSGAHQAESVRVFDYSLARPMQPAAFVDDRGQYTRHAFYLAPEQLTSGVIDRRSDVYAFGVILYRALTGRMPFSSEHEDEFARWIYAQDPPPPPLAAGLTPAVHRVLVHAMARNPAERFDSCNDFANALETLVRVPSLSELYGAPVPASAPRRPPLARAATLPMPRVTVPEPYDAAPPPAAASKPAPAFTTAPGFTAPAPAFTTAPGFAASPAFTAPPGLESMKTVRLPKVVEALGPGAAAAPQPDTDAHEAERRPPQPTAAEDAAPLEPQAYSRPIDRRMLWAAGCFALVGVVPLLAYYTPAVERPEAQASSERGPVAVAVAAAPEAVAAVATEARVWDMDGVDMELIDPIHVPSTETARAPDAPRDDPDTLVDESDPLIAAALAAIRGESARPAPLSPEQRHSHRNLSRASNDAHGAAKRLAGGVAAKAPPATKPPEPPRAAVTAPAPAPAPSAPAPPAPRAARMETVNVRAPAVQQIGQPAPAAATPERTAPRARQGDMSLF